MKSLVRTRVGRFDVKDSRTLEQIQKLADCGRVQEAILPLDQMFDRDPAVVAGSSLQKRVYNGNSFYGRDLSRPVPGLKDGCRVRVYDGGGAFVGLYRYREKEDEFRLVKMFRDGGGQG